MAEKKVLLIFLHPVSFQNSNSPRITSGLKHSYTNNILIGKEEPFDELKSVNVGMLILKAFKSRPEFIGQVTSSENKNFSLNKYMGKASINKRNNN